MADLDLMELANPERIAYQGIVIRFVSLLIDGIIIGIIFGALGTILGVGMMERGTAPWSWGLFYFIFYIGYYTYLEGSRGQTIGKMITKIKNLKYWYRPLEFIGLPLSISIRPEKENF